MSNYCCKRQQDVKAWGIPLVCHTCRRWTWCRRSYWDWTVWTRRRCRAGPCSCSSQRPGPPPGAVAGPDSAPPPGMPDSELQWWSSANTLWKPPFWAFTSIKSPKPNWSPHAWGPFSMLACCCLITFNFRLQLGHSLCKLLFKVQGLESLLVVVNAGTQQKHNDSKAWTAATEPEIRNTFTVQIISHV